MEISLLLKQNIAKAVKNLYGLDVQNIVIEHPENSKWGDYATNVALGLSKELKQAPLEIAKKICYEIQSFDLIFESDGQKYQIFEKIDIASPGFINFTLSIDWLRNVLYEVLTQKGNYGVGKSGSGKRIALEHSNVNPNKAAHVGHLRNACVGQFLEKSYENLGYEVEVQYYANDLGVQVATSAMGVQKIKNISPENYKKYDHFAWEVYSKMESMIAADPLLQKERQDLLVKLEDPNCVESINQKTLAKKIIIEQLKTFQKIGIDYDIVIHESDIVNLKLWETAFEKLKVNENVYYAKEGKSQGCWLVKMKLEASTNAEVDVEEDKIIVRSNGVPTYTGKDIAYHMWKYGLLGKDFCYEEWKTGTQAKPLWMTSSDSTCKPSGVTFSNVDFVFDVIGVEQTYAMSVVKTALKYLGYEQQSENMKHVNYGFVYLSKETAGKLGIDTSDGKPFYAMSGRKGWGVKIDDLVDMVDSKLKADFGNFSAVEAVRNAAVKFQMLKLNTFQDLVFDLEEALDFKGYSGPYLQYTYARTFSVLEKAGWLDRIEGLFVSSYVWEPSELEVVRELYKYQEVAVFSALRFAPNLLCEYLFSLAKKFNAMYANVSILNAESVDAKNFRLMLAKSVGQVLKNGLWLLGIDVVERM
ncbi:MAG: hypothetical protein ACD_22C00031G0006 [uncultured bacterium]|nr:MAG: hypothetical protein ACD_22C00031G0006 [uncultured bacterium]